MPDASVSDNVDRYHLVLIATASPPACLAAVASALSRVGGEIHTFSLKPVGRQFEAVLRLIGVDDEGAERAAAMIVTWPHAGSVRIEHRWMRR